MDIRDPSRDGMPSGRWWEHDRPVGLLAERHSALENSETQPFRIVIRITSFRDTARYSIPAKVALGAAGVRPGVGVVRPGAGVVRLGAGCRGADACSVRRRLSSGAGCRQAGRRYAPVSVRPPIRSAWCGSAAAAQRNAQHHEGGQQHGADGQLPECARHPGGVHLPSLPGTLLMGHSTRFGTPAVVPVR